MKIYKVYKNAILLMNIRGIYDYIPIKECTSFLKNIRPIEEYMLCILICATNNNIVPLTKEMFGEQEGRKEGRKATFGKVIF